MRKTYRFNHKVVQGGLMYAHRCNGIIKNKEGLRNAIKAVAAKLELIDPTIKVYDSIFFLFFLSRKFSEKEIAEKIQRNISGFADWDKEYLYTAVHDLQEEYVRKDLERFGFDYDKG